MGDISIKGKSPILRQSFAVGGAVRRLGKALRGRKGRGKDFKTHGRDVPTMAAKGGRIGLRTGSRGPSAGERIKARKARADEWWTGKRGSQSTYVPGLDKELREKRPHSSPEGRMRDIKTAFAKSKADRIQSTLAKYNRPVPSGRALHKKGGKADKNWMQKVSASIKKRGTKGKCTPITKPGCTGRAKALARTFKKMGRERKAKG